MRRPRCDELQVRVLSLGSGRGSSPVAAKTSQKDRRNRAPALAVGASALVLLLPLVVAPGGFQRHVTLRWALLGFVVVVGAWSVRRTLWQAIPPPVVAAWTGVLVTLALASFAAVVPLRALIGESDRRAGLLSFLMVAGLFALGAAVRSERMVVLRAGPVATAIVTFAMLGTLGTQELAVSRGVLVGNSGQLGGYLVILAGLNLVVATTDADHRWRRSGVVGAPVALVLVLLTGSYAALIGGAALLVLFALHRGGGRSTLPWLAAAVGGASGLGLTALAWPAQFRALGPSVQGRVDTWAVSVDVVLERPWFGWGPEGLRHGFASVVPESFVADWGDLRVQDRAHSLLLDHAAASGLLGLGALLVFVAVLARHILRDGKREDRALGVVLVAFGIFLVGWFLEFDLAAVIALLAGLATPGAGQPPPPAVRGALVVLTIVAGSLVAIIGTVAVIEDHRFRSALQGATDAVVSDRSASQDDAAAASSMGHREEIVSLFRRSAAPTSGYTEMLAAIEFAPAASLVGIEEVLLEFERAAVWHDPGRDAEIALITAQLHLERARRVRDAPTVSAAEDAFDRVFNLAPNHSFAWRGLATARLLGDDPAAEQALVVLARLRPEDVGARHDLAVLEIQRGDPDGAARWLDAACGIAPDDPQLHGLAQAVRELGADPAACPRATPR